MLYSTILQNSSIVSDYTEEVGDFQEVLQGIFKQNQNEKDFYIIEYQNFHFFFLRKHEYTFASITNPEVDREHVHAFLISLKENFSIIKQSEREHITLKVTQLMKDMMNKFNIKENGSIAKIEKIERELKEIEMEKSAILISTLEKDACLDSLLSKSDNLKRSCKELKNFSKKSKKNSKTNNLRYYTIGLVVILLVTGYFFHRFIFTLFK